MKTASHMLRTVLCALLLTGFLSGVMYAASIDISIEDFDLSEDDISPGDSFDMDLTIKNTDGDNNLSSTDDIELTIYFDGELVYEDDNLGHDSLDYEETESFSFSAADEFGDNWDDEDGMLLGYICGDNLNVKVQLTGDVSATDDQDIDISGSELTVDMEPEEPGIEDEILITVVDKVGNELNNVNVRLSNLGSDEEWDSEDKMRVSDTSSDGTVKFSALSKDIKFKSEPFGKYQLDVWDDNYCLKTLTFDVENKLQITEVPETPYVGEEIGVKVLDADELRVAGATLTVSGKGGVVGSYSSDNNGYVFFEIKNSGSHTLLASKSGFGDSEAVTLNVVDRKGTNIKIEPTEQSVGKDVTITVTSSGSPIDGAEITIERPDGKTDVRTASSAGKITYRADVYGTYDVTAEKTGYETASSSFSAVNLFDVSLTEKPRPYEDIVVTVKNQGGSSISGASVEVSGSDVRGSTDSSGRFTFSLPDAGEYTLSVKKEGYDDYSKKLTVYGVLEVDVEPESLELDDSVTITVSDDSGNAVVADIKITQPDGEKEVVRKSSHTFTPEIAGEYVVNATKSFYLSSASGFNVEPYLLELNVWLSGEELNVKTTSRGKIASGVSVSVTTPEGGEFELKTDDEGIAKLNIKELNQTGAFNVRVVDLRYEDKSVEREITGFGSNTLLLAVLGIAMLTILASIILVVFYLMHKKGKESKIPSTKRKKGKNSGLGKI